MSHSSSTNPSRTRFAYSPAEAAECLGICRASIYNLIARGEIMSVKIGRCRRIPASELARILGGDDDAPAS